MIKQRKWLTARDNPSCYVFVMLSCASVYWCLVVTCWERAELLALVLDVLLSSCHFPICTVNSEIFARISFSRIA